MVGGDVVRDVIVAAIAAFPPTIVAFAGLRRSKKNAKALEQVHIQIDGKLHQLIEATARLAALEGYKRGLSAKRQGNGDRRRKRRK